MKPKTRFKSAIAAGAALARRRVSKYSKAKRRKLEAGARRSIAKGSQQRLVRARLIRLKIGETTRYGDWCCNERDAQQPVEITGGSWEIKAEHHPVYRIVVP